ncbi:DEAD/DEAH box helicase family protein [Mycoplasmopsis synoviae]|uniref:DEAD/DEAH box helicase family protein n=1 Tax=Mycoplasmopsis synoviae TaxID=2109 RepID=UPI0034DB44E5
MNLKLTETQKNAVDQIVEYWRKKQSKELIFKAPTGSGKTFMMAQVIDKMISQANIKKLFFIIATPSSAELPKQFFNKLNYYKNSFLNKNKVKIELIESPSSTNKKDYKSYHLKPEENKVMIFGKSSFGKKRIYTEQEIIDALFNEIKNDSSFELIYIRDEAHIGTKIQKKFNWKFWKKD